MALQFAKVAATRLPARVLKVGVPRDILYLWSDAEFSGSSQMGYGWVLSSRKWKFPLAAWGRVPKHIAEQFRSRLSQICVGEALAAVSAPFTVPELMQDHDVIHFVDNQGALACLINGCSRADDVGAVASMYQLILAKLGCRCWAEYVESSANIADGPSRDGHEWHLADECVKIGARLIEARLPALEDLYGSSLSALFDMFPSTVRVRDG